MVRIYESATKIDCKDRNGNVLKVGDTVRILTPSKIEVVSEIKHLELIGRFQKYNEAHWWLHLKDGMQVWNSNVVKVIYDQII